jgi:hypothetical protein
MIRPHHLVTCALMGAAAAACSSGVQPEQPTSNSAPPTAGEPTAPSGSAPASGTIVGEFRENQFGAWGEWRPVKVGAAVRFTPEDGWSTQQEAEAALARLAESGPGRPSSVALLAIGDRFVARYLVTEDGGDLRPWHAQTETRPQDRRWIATVHGPTMVVKVSAQAQAEDWCQAYIQGSWGAVPATSESFKPTTDPALLQTLYSRRTRFDGGQVHEWKAGGGPKEARVGSATFATDKETCRVTVDLGGSSEVREYLPASDDTMHLVVKGSSSPLFMKRLTGDDGQPPK